MNTYIALDVGGTKTHIGLFRVDKSGDHHLIKENKYSTQKAKSLEEILLDFHNDFDEIVNISIAVAGPVIADNAQLTNVSWKVNIPSVKAATGVNHIYLLNDLEASAFGIPFMGNQDLLNIYQSDVNIAGNAAVIAPGTGLGEAGMYWDGTSYHPFATEGGHCDFSPRDNDDVNLLVYLQHKYGHVSWERLVSGMGIVNIFDFLRTSSTHSLDPKKEAQYLTGDIAANISKAAVSGESIAIETMELFVQYLAIESANLALKFKSTGGLYIGGGIIPKIWNERYQSIFLEYFFDVGRLESLLRCISVTIILNPTSVLLGSLHYGVVKSKL